MLIGEEDRHAVLEPIEGGVGIDGREDEGSAADLLREIRSQRKALVKLEQAMSMGGDDEFALPDGGWNWETIGEQARNYLIQFGKDLEPMAALLEATARDGPEEFASGMALLADLVEAFWERGLYPAEDDDGVSTRFQPLSGLSGGGNDREGALIVPVRRMILARFNGDTLRHLDKVRADTSMAQAQTSASDKEARIEEAQATYAKIEQFVRRAGRANIAAAEAAIAAAHADWRRTIAFVAERTKPQFPAASRLTDELEAIRSWLQGLLSLLPEDVPMVAEVLSEAGGEAAAAVVGAGNSGTVIAPASGFVGGKITRRDEALKAIGLVVDYFAAYEPLSPLGATLREVDRRARMSLNELLAELIPDESARTEFYWRSGVKPPVAGAAE